MGTLGLTVLRGQVWAGGAQSEGKADYRKRSWKALFVWKTGRTWVSQQATDLFIAHLTKQKVFRIANCFLIPLSGVFPRGAAVVLKLEGSRVLLRYMVHCFNCVYSTRHFMCLSLEMKAHISVYAGTCFLTYRNVEPQEKRRDSLFS